MARPIGDPYDGSGGGQYDTGGGTSWPGAGRCPVGMTWNATHSLCQDAAGNLYDSNGVLIVAASASQNGDVRCRALSMMYSASNGYCSDGAGAWYDFNGRFVSRDGTTPVPVAAGLPTVNLAGLTDALRAHPYIAGGLAIGLFYMFSKKKGY